MDNFEGKDFDKHGFAVKPGEDEDERCSKCRKNNIATPTSTINNQKLLWEKFLRGWPESHMELRWLLKQGVPPEMRGDVWRALLGCEQLRSTSSFSYQKCIQDISQQLEELQISEDSLNIDNHQLEEAGNSSENVEGKIHKPAKMGHPIALKTLRQIIVDVYRTFPTHRLFMGHDTSAKEGQASLFRLLSAYSIYNSEVGYCQGMSYIAGMLLMQMASEEESFWAMVALFEKPKYLSGYFDSSLQRIQNHSAIFQKLLLQRYPKLGKHFISLGVDPLMFVTPWFMCLFTSMPCWETVLAIWDLLLLDGISTNFRVALSILHLDSHRCLSCDEIDQVLPKLLHPPAQLVELTTFMPVVWEMTVDESEIQQAIVEEGAEKPVSEENQPESVLQKIRNVLNPLGQRKLQDASNIVGSEKAPSSIEMTPVTRKEGVLVREMTVDESEIESLQQAIVEEGAEKPVSEENQPESILQKIRNVLNPLGQRKLQDASNIVGSEKAPSSIEMTPVTRYLLRDNGVSA